jgi:PAS domain S-box-containing protein
MDSVIRRSGIDVIGDVPWGTHFCQFYKTSQDLIETLVPYFREGLAANEFCMWVTSEPLQVDQATAALRAAVPDLDDCIEKGQIEILDYSQWYTRSGKFLADEVLQGWVDKLNAALRQGYEGLRLTGNTFWLEQADWDDFTRYEEEINDVIGQYRMLAICTYSLQKCSALEILDVVTNHQFALIKRSGQWQIIKSAEQLKTAQALQESEMRYATTLASIGDAVIATDTDGRITFVNTVAEKLTGWTFHEALMLPVTDVFNIINEYTRQEVDNPVAKVLQLGGIVGLANHTILIRKDGTQVAIDDSGSPIKDLHGKIMGVVLVFRDITERRQAEEKLRQANERLELAQRASGAGVWDWDITTGHLEWSSELFDLFGLDPQKDIASFEVWNSVLHSEDLEIAGLRIDQALKDHTGLNSEYRIIRPDGQLRWINALGHGKYDDLGRPVRMMGICIDITVRKKTEEALRKSEERAQARSVEMELVLNSVPAAIWIAHDPLALHITGNKLSYEWLHIPSGVNASKSAPKGERPETFRMFKDGNELQPAEMPVQLSAMGKEIQDYEFTFVYPDGTKRYVLGNAMPLFNDNGKPRGSVSSFIDITKRKQAEEALRNSEEEYRYLVENAPICIYELDFVGRRFKRVNDVMCQVLGYTRNELMASDPSDLLDEESWLRFQERISRVLVGEPIDESVEYRILGKYGKEIWAALRVKLMHTDGKFDGALVFAQDITERKRMEDALREARDGLESKVLERTIELSEAKEELECTNEELREEIEDHKRTEEALWVAKDEAEAAAKAKAAFMANMSHELRTPMNAVIGFTSLLLDEDLSPEHKELIEGIRNGGEAMMTLIGNILDFSRAEKKKIELEHRPISLRHCVEESLDMVALEADKKGLNLAYTVSYGTPDTIIGDHGRLRQILVNLLSNAVKFTDIGDVSVSVSSQAVEVNKCLLHFSVKDTGIGIPQDKIGIIFEPFTQLERTISRKREGVGLGLAITRNLVELMDGKIWAESITGQGTTIHVSIWAETIPGRQLDLGEKERKSLPKSIPGERALRILVAEDNPSNQKVLVEMLKRMGYRPDAVADGLEAVQALERLPYDLILMDVRMPEMDGITATQVIRKLRPENGPAIVAITAYALEGDREKCLEAGMNDYLSKPVQKNKLESILMKYSGDAT